MRIAKHPFWRVVPNDGHGNGHGNGSGEAEGAFILPVTQPATVGPPGNPFTMGGVCLAAAIDALELASEQPLLWATIQFLIPSHGAEELHIITEQIGGGHNVGHWQVEIFSGPPGQGRMIQRVSAAMGAREPAEQTVFAAMPDVPAPEQCTAKPPDPNGSDDNLIGQLERRVALADHESGMEAVWMRSRAGFANDAALLAIMSDFFLGAHPRSRTGSSLDATLRFIQSAPSGWVLSVTQMAAFDRGVAHGHAHHFTEEGQLLALSSQSGVLPRIPMAE